MSLAITWNSVIKLDCSYTLVWLCTSTKICKLAAHGGEHLYSQ